MLGLGLGLVGSMLGLASRVHARASRVHVRASRVHARARARSMLASRPRQFDWPRISKPRQI